MPRSPLSKIAQSAFGVDTCGDITGYKCSWLITSGKAFEKHLAEVHPEGEHR